VAEILVKAQAATVEDGANRASGPKHCCSDHPAVGVAGLNAARATGNNGSLAFWPMERDGQRPDGRATLLGQMFVAGPSRFARP